MKDDVKAAIRTALKEFDDWVAFAWRFAEVEFDHYACLPEDPDPAKLFEHYREERDFTVEFAGKLEGARCKMVEAVNAPLAEAAPSGERRWLNSCVSFRCFDCDMAASWKALTTVLDHNDAHPPDEAHNAGVDAVRALVEAILARQDRPKFSPPRRELFRETCLALLDASQGCKLTTDEAFEGADRAK